MDIASNPRTVEEIFKDYSSRRTAIVRALTYGNPIFSSLHIYVTHTYLYVYVYVCLIIFMFLSFSTFPFQMLMNFTPSVIQVCL